MTTSELITTIIDDYANGYSRTKILGYLNRCQKMLFNNDCAMTTFLNASDPEFPIPFLSTTAGQLSYDLSTASLVDSAGAAVSVAVGGHAVNARRVKEVFLKSGVGMFTDPNRTFYGDSFTWSGMCSAWFGKLYNFAFYRVPVILFDKTEHSGARIQFAEDPGTHADRYYIEFYHEPIDLTAETIDLSVNGSEWEQALIDGVVGIIEDVENGESKRYEKFQTYWMDKFKRKFNAGMESRRPLQISARECG